jgi:hypothetical protein
MIKVKVLGAKKSAANIRNMDKAVRKRLYEEMLEISRKILVRSHRYVPYDTGKLQRSGKVEGYPGRYPVVYTSYGGPDVPYALIQHENVEYIHPGGRRAKYLELAVGDYEPQIAKAFEVALRNETQKFSMAGGVMTRVG